MIVQHTNAIKRKPIFGLDIDSYVLSLGGSSKTGLVAFLSWISLFCSLLTHGNAFFLFKSPL